MLEVIVSPDADADIFRIWLFLDSKNPRAAEGIFRGLYEQAKSLSTLPKRGTPRDDLAPRLRVLVHLRFLIFYRYDQTLDEVHIIRILEGERDLTDFS